MKKVFVTGAKGQLGRDIMAVLKERGVPSIGVDINDFDLCDASAVKTCIKAFEPQVVIHCAAYVEVDKAQRDAEQCYRVNVEATANVARACIEVDAQMLYVSTDYVFTGAGDTAYEIDDAKGSKSVYGATKYCGELAVQILLDKWFIARISWLFGVGGNNFVETMLRLSKTKDRLMVVDDQIGSPTFSADAAQTLCDIALSDKYGIYHVTNEGVCSWNEFAKTIFTCAGCSVQVDGISSDQYGATASRPLNSRLSKESLDRGGFARLPSWQDALCRYLQLRQK